MTNWRELGELVWLVLKFFATASLIGFSLGRLLQKLVEKWKEQEHLSQQVASLEAKRSTKDLHNFWEEPQSTHWQANLPPEADPKIKLLEQKLHDLQNQVAGLQERASNAAMQAHDKSEQVDRELQLLWEKVTGPFGPQPANQRRWGLNQPLNPTPGDLEYINPRRTHC